ncbi:MAG: S-layer homology domain-containing protein [Oscillospiraceae bacterium]
MTKFMEKSVARIMAFVLAAFVAFGSYCLPIYAEDTEKAVDLDVTENMEMLMNFNMLSSKFVADKNLKISRGEFARELVYILGKSENLLNDTKMVYYDVPPESEYFSYINTIKALGYMSGSGDNRFLPNEPITITDAVTTLVKVLGYDVVAKEIGYPAGYISKAYSLNLLDGVAAGAEEDLTSKQLVMIFCNMLECPVMSVKTYGDVPEYTVNNDSNFLEEYHKIFWKNGRIDGNYLDSFGKGLSNLSENKISIDGEEYSLSDEMKYINDYLGYYVKVYYKEVNDNMNILYFVKNSQNELIIDSSDMRGFKNGKLSYVGKDGKVTKEVNIPKSTTIIYNGMVESTYMDDIFNIKNGSIELLGNNSGGFDIIKIYSYNDYFVSGVSKEEKNIFFKNSNDVLKLNDFKETIIRDANGMTIKFEDIIPNTILSVGKSLDNEKCVYIVKSDRVIKGKIDMVTKGDKDYIGNIPENFKIGDITYKSGEAFSRNSKKTFSPGNEVAIYLNYQGLMAYAETQNVSVNTDWKYGFLMNAAITNKFSGTIEFKIFTSDAKAKVYKGIEKINMDGEKMTDASILKLLKTKNGVEEPEVVSQLIKYRLSNDEISMIDTAIVGKNENKETSLSLDVPEETRRFSLEGMRLVSPVEYNMNIRVDNQTCIFTVPLDLDERRSDEKGYGIKNFGYFQNQKSYEHILAYDIDFKNGDLTPVLVQYGAGMETEYGESTIIVDEIATTLDDDGVPTKKLYGVTRKGERVEFEANDEEILKGEKPVTFDMLEHGDIIRCMYDSRGRATSIKISLNVSEGDNNKNILEQEGIEIWCVNAAYLAMYGVNTNIEAGYANFSPSFTPPLDGDGEVERGKITVTLGDAPTILVDMKRDTIEKVSSDVAEANIWSRNPNARVFLQTRLSKIETMVIYNFE